MWKDKPCGFSSIDGIHALLGWEEDGQEVRFELGDDPPHAILAGTAGSGKSNLLHVLIQGLLHRFSPDELNLYLLDYKDGVEFNVYAGAKIPQIKFVATVNDSEYGINALKYFQEEITRRNDEFSGVSSLKVHVDKNRNLFCIASVFNRLNHGGKVNEYGKIYRSSQRRGTPGT